MDLSQSLHEADFQGRQKKWHRTHERKSKGEKSLKGACLSTSGKRAETNPVRPPAGLLYGQRTNRSMPENHLAKKGASRVEDTHVHTHTLTFPGGTLLRGKMTVWGEGGALYLKWNAGLQGAFWHTGHREQGEVRGGTLGAHGEHGLLSLRKEAQDIDRVSPHKPLRLPWPAIEVRRGS